MRSHGTTPLDTPDRHRPPRRRSLPGLAVAVPLALVLQGCGPERWGENVIERGRSHALGRGWVQTYAELAPDGSLAALGVAIKERALENLPTSMYLVRRMLEESARGCFDLDGDGELDAPRECALDHTLAPPLPRGLERDVRRPVAWMSLSWYPQGHDRPGVYNLPHFDVRFHLKSPESFAAIGYGPCGVVIDCDDFARATVPVPEPYLPRDYADVRAALPRLGNLLVDSTLVEFADSTPASPEDSTPTAPSDGAPSRTQAFVYGAFAGELTFWQLLATHTYLETKPAECEPIKQPRAWAVSGLYPTERCVRWVEEKGEFRLSVETFVYREATF